MTLIAAGVAGSALLLLLTGTATRNPGSTLGQLALLAVALAVLGPRFARSALARARELPADRIGSGEPTPLVHVVAVVAVLTVVVAGAGALLGAEPAWDAGLRVTAGSALVGVCQVGLIAPRVAREERTRGRTFYRMPGSRLGRGTVLAAVPR